MKYSTKRDDGSIDKMDKSRFTQDFSEVKRMQGDIEKWNKYFLKELLKWKYNE